MAVLDARWRRVELVPMDPYCADISVGLYRSDGAEGRWVSCTRTAPAPGSSERVRVSRPCDVGSRRARRGEDDGSPDPLRLQHLACLGREAAVPGGREAGSLRPGAPRPLEVPDTRSEQTIRIEPLGNGAYSVRAEGVTEEAPSRAPAIAAALVKLAQLDRLGRSGRHLPLWARARRSRRVDAVAGTESAGRLA